jgi:AraC-like DNA-binding protein
VNVLGPLRTGHLIGLDDLVARYAGADAARLITLSQPWPSASSNPYLPVSFETVARAYDSLVLNVDSLMNLLELNTRLGTPWDVFRLAGRYAEQTRSRTLIEHRSRMQSVTRMWASNWRPRLLTTATHVTFGGDATNYPSLGFVLQGLCRSVHQIRELGGGVDPLKICLPFRATRWYEARLERELPGIRWRFEPGVFELSYDRDAFHAACLPEYQGHRISYRDLLKVYLPPGQVRPALRVIDAIESTIFKDMREPKLDQIASAAKVEARAIQRTLRQSGLTLRSVIERLRVVAAEDLAETSEPVIDVAVAVGYTSQQALSKAFRRWRGLSPTEFRSRTAGLQDRARVGATAMREPERAPRSEPSRRPQNRRATS